MPKVLLLDIETSPHLATVWGLFKQNVALSQLLEPSALLCWAAKWEGQDDSEMQFARTGTKRQHRAMIKKMWTLLDEADIVVHYNGKSFDVPVLNREFLTHGLTPPSPFHQVDLYQTVKKRFRFASNKLAHVSVQLGLEGKVKVDHEVWLGCMNNDPKAWAKMEEYNKGDVVELEKTYNKLLPWIVQHANLAMYIQTDAPTCSHCGSTKVHKRGYQHLKTQTYQRYRCMSCGAWLRARLAEKRTDKRLVPLEL